MKAIVWTGELEVRTDVEVRDLRANEVRVRIHAAGLCHSDVSVVNGTIPFPTPAVMGHEGAGVVEQIGAGVSTVKVGDHVVLTTLGNCGQCGACDRGQATFCRVNAGRLKAPFTVGGEKAFQFANAGVFAEHTVVTETQAVVIDKDVPFASACFIGCAVLTGTGAVLNRAKPRIGQSAMVIGIGGIGLSVLQGLALSNCGTIIAVDANPAKEAAALQFGATHFIAAGPDVDTAEAVKAILPNGVDYAFECVGHPALIRQSIDLLDWGGSAVLLGVPKFGSEASFMVNTLYNDKSIMGCRYGSARPHHDIPLFIELYKAGKLKLDELVSATYQPEQVQEALDAMHGGGLNRAVLTFAD
ncbi:Zn-dependent alcohol dehydrogenase [Aquihabitans sp. G128]|uniref:Zn-dependent alcohol dehydrogenase n=1 Tax=Aquihabitans sp. G128 TaxID=2849779 RepID=UPI001C21539F|nr:Zn-dependent alcohol dehydrogenase [Aquihabitans sp. G128]QXC63018.1 Zn-dependent alcohol dehydrogenase [Aquihabitans sp. G128]